MLDKTGNFEGALNAYQSLLKLDPNNQDAFGRTAIYRMKQIYYFDKYKHILKEYGKIYKTILNILFCITWFIE